MTTTRRRDLGLIVLLTFLVAVTMVVGWWLLTRSGTSSSADGEADAVVRGPGSSVTISGDAVSAISPGSMAPLDLALDNTNDFDLAIDQITVTVRHIDAPRADTDHPCSAADFEVRQLSKSVVLTLDGNRADDLSGLGLARRLWPAVGMRNRPVNQDGCKGAFLRLGYEASGAKVHR